MSTRKNDAQWMEKQQRWQIKVQRDGVRRAFYSSNPSRRGKVEAERKADQWLESGYLDKDPRFPVAWEEFLKHLLEKSKQSKKARGTAHHKKCEQQGRLYLAPEIKNRKVLSITPALWQRCIDKQYERGLSKKTLVTIRSTITLFCRYMRRNGVRIETPELEIPDDAPVGKRKILQPDALKTLFSEDSVESYGRQKKCHYIYAWRFQVLSGYRPGEVCGLQKTDKDGNLLTINRSVNVDGEITDGKNANANRTKYLSKAERLVLEEQAKMLQSMGIVTKWLFPSSDGGPGDEKAMYREWLRYCAQHGFRCSLYELRHTFVSYAQGRVPEKLLKAVVGHSKSMDTFGTYGHLVKGDLEKAAEYVDDIFDEFVG